MSKRLTYVGPFDAVVIEVAPQLTATVAHGEEVEVSDQLGESLLDQPDNWQPAKTAKPAAAKEA
jgi:hypothetical protein